MDFYNIFFGIIQIFKLDFQNFVIIFNSISIEYTWITFLIFSFVCVLIFLKIFGEVGLYIYTVVAVIVANIQVLKLVKFSFFVEPVALGTILFASTFLCTDILAEYFSLKKARKNVLIGFSGLFIFSGCLILIFCCIFFYNIGSLTLFSK